MEQVPKQPSSFRYVDIEKEILKGKSIKPGILDDDPEPGPSKKAKLVVLPPKDNIALPSFLINNAQPTVVPAEQAPVALALSPVPVVPPKATKSVKCMVKIEAMPEELKNKPSILRRIPQPKVVAETVPVDQMWSEMKNGVRFVHPSSLDQDMLHRVVDTLKIERSLKNTIISLPDKVFLVPLSCFSGAVLPPDSLVSVRRNAAETQEKEEAPRKLKHPCWNGKKNRKLDLDGLTAFDRLGFYKADAQRSLRCQRIVENIANRLVQSIEKLKSEINVLESQLRKKRKSRKKVHSKPFTKMRTLKRRQKKTQVVENVVVKESVTSSNESVLPVLDHSNFEQFRDHARSIFVNNDNIATAIILHTFPDFKAAVEKGVVRVIDESLLQSSRL